MEKILSVTTTRERTLSTEKINGEFAYYESRRVEKDGENVISDSTKYGFAPISSVMAVKGMDCVDDRVEVDWMYENSAYIIQVPTEEFEKVMNCEKHITSLDEYMLTFKPYDPENCRYFLWNSNAWQLADLDRRAVACPVYFNYIDAHVYGDTFDIDGLLGYLKANPDVYKAAKYNGRKEIVVERVPYYNNDGMDDDRTICFYYIPTQEIADAIKDMDTYQKYNYIIEHTGLKDYRRG